MAVVLLASLVSAGPVASAYPHDFFSCGKPIYQYEFVNTSTQSWTSTQKSEFNDAADNWDFLKSPGATGGGGVYYLYDSAELSASTNDIRWGVLPSGIGGSTNVSCNGTDITLNALDLLNPDGSIEDPPYYRYVVAHEVGHAHGLKHSGELDNQKGNQALGSYPSPVMETCLSSSARTDVVQTDDYANAIAETFSSGVNANQSFERGKWGWGTTKAPSWSVISGFGSEGDKYARFTSTPNYATLWQPVRVEEPESYWGRVNYRRESGFGGTINIQIQARQIDFPGASGCESGQFSGGLDFNDPSFAGASTWVTRRNFTFAPSISSSWNYYSVTDPVSSYPWSQPVDEGWDAADVRVRVVFVGISGVMNIDNTRLLGN